mmetsp:Transcript_25268/g.74182  ORF Transcript_25268/g.74182 Transcript_25268/m.74182 type:complete len:439 (+) Transcript_25268:348-1664(+)
MRPLVASRWEMASFITFICVCTEVWRVLRSSAISWSSPMAACSPCSASLRASSASCSLETAPSPLWFMSATVEARACACSLARACLASSSFTCCSAAFWRSSASACAAARAASAICHVCFSPSSSPTRIRSLSACALARTTCCAQSAVKAAAALRRFSISSRCFSLRSCIASRAFSTCALAWRSARSATPSALAWRMDSFCRPWARRSTASRRDVMRACTSSASTRTLAAVSCSSAFAVGCVTSTCSARFTSRDLLASASATPNSPSSSRMLAWSTFASAAQAAALDLSAACFSFCLSNSRCSAASLSRWSESCDDVSAIATPCECASSWSACRRVCSSLSALVRAMMDSSASSDLALSCVVSCAICILSVATSCLRLFTIVRSTRRISLHFGLSQISSGRMAIIAAADLRMGDEDDMLAQARGQRAPEGQPVHNPPK